MVDNLVTQSTSEDTLVDQVTLKNTLVTQDTLEGNLKLRVFSVRGVMGPAQELCIGSDRVVLGALANECN